MKHLILGILLVLIAPQEFESLELVKSIEGEYDLLRTDNLGKLYLIKNDEVFMYDASGNFIGRNSNKLFGRINDLDATNSLELLTFFQEQIQLVFLDNQLAIKGREIPLEMMEFDQISEVCVSHGSGVWLFDQVRMELTRLDKNNRQVATSGNLRQTLGYTINPLYMREVNNWLYVNDPELGIMVFDVFGAYYKTLPIKGIGEFQVKDKQVIFWNDPYLVKFNQVDLEFDTAMEIKGNPKSVLVTKNQLNILFDNKLDIHKYTP